MLKVTVTENNFTFGAKHFYTDTYEDVSLFNSQLHCQLMCDISFHHTCSAKPQPPPFLSRCTNPVDALALDNKLTPFSLVEELHTRNIWSSKRDCGV